MQGVSGEGMRSIRGRVGSSVGYVDCLQCVFEFLEGANLL